MLRSEEARRWFSESDKGERERGGWQDCKTVGGTNYRA